MLLSICYTHFDKTEKGRNTRVILSLKSFNDYIDNFNFKMDSLSTAINLTNK